MSEMTDGLDATEPEPGRTWTLRDIPRAVQISFDLQKLGVGAAGLTAAAIAYGMFSWLGDQTGEKAAHRVFTVLGGIFASCFCVLTAGLVARMSTVQLLENRRAGAAEMREFARERWGTLLGIPLAFGGVTVLMLMMQAMLSMVGAIPGVGPIIYSASFLMAFAMSLVVVIVTALHLLGFFLYPSIVAIRGGGAVAAMLEVIELARRQPLMLLMYEGVVAVVGCLMTLITGSVVWASVRLTNATAEGILGERFATLQAAIPSFFRIFLRPLRTVLPLQGIPEGIPWHYDLGGILLGFSLLVLVILTLTYPFVFFTSAGSITYLILRPEPVPRDRSPIEDL